MSDEGVQYEFRDVRTVRGAEARTIAKWVNDGWELDAQSQGSLVHTKLTFRRLKPKQPWYLWAGLVSVVILVVVGIIIGVILEGDNDPEPTAQPSDAATTTNEDPSTESRQETDSLELEPEDTVRPVAEAEARWLEMHMIGAPIEFLSQEGYDHFAPLHAILPGWSGSTDGYLRISVQESLAGEQVRRLGINILNFIGPEFRDIDGIVFRDSTGRDHNFYRRDAPMADLD